MSGAGGAVYSPYFKSHEHGVHFIHHAFNGSAHEFHNFNPFVPGSRTNVSTACFSAFILRRCLSEHDDRRLTLALVYMVIGLCVLSRNEKAKFA